MNFNRRHFLGLTGSLGVVGASQLAGLDLTNLANASDFSDYRALVCIYLNGGNDSNNTLIPLDAAFGDYTKARGGLALPKDSLVPLQNNTASGHPLGLHPGLRTLAGLYQSGQLAWVTNMGPLVEPTTASKILSRSGQVPPFLFSHSDQENIQLGWDGFSSDVTGWGGRSIESLTAEYRHRMQLVSFNNKVTWLKGKESAVTYAPTNYANYFASGDLTRADDLYIKTYENISQLKSANYWDNVRSSNLKNALADARGIANGLANVPQPQGNFTSDRLGEMLRQTAKLMYAGKLSGMKRQLFLISWGSFDNHSGQLGTAASSQDVQLATLGANLEAYVAALAGFGLTNNVTTFSLSDFARTLQPVGGDGTDHAWGGHHFVFGGAVQGGQVLGTFPQLVLGGVDDMDDKRKGRWVPTTSTDQYAATLMRWMGLPDNKLQTVFPNLANFGQKTLNFV
jgi:uncharacterized protein (DUF1501 family)